jgi:hypothetical protein
VKKVRRKKIGEEKSKGRKQKIENEIADDENNADMWICGCGTHSANAWRIDCSDD